VLALSIGMNANTPAIITVATSIVGISNLFIKISLKYAY